MSRDPEQRSVLVTGAGGGVGQSILKSLRGTRYRGVAMDPDPLAVGLHVAPVGVIGPRASDASYVGDVLEIARREGCELVFPGTEYELGPLARSVGEFAEAGITVVVSSPEVVGACDDKLATSEFLASRGLATPVTVDFADWDSTGFPVVLKPRRGGARSVGVHEVRDEDELARTLPWIDPENCVVQEHIVGEEFTCGSVTLDGRCRGVVAMRRTLRAGDTYRATVVHNTRIHDHVAAVVEALGIFGAGNVQLRLRDGEPMVFEVNARCSGTTAARAALGFNEPLAIADFLLEGTVPDLRARSATVLRYWQELVVTEEELDAIGGGRVEHAGGRV